MVRGAPRAGGGETERTLGFEGWGQCGMRGKERAECTPRPALKVLVLPGAQVYFVDI